MKTILFIYPKKASFINLDITILSEKYQVVQNTYQWEKKVLVPFFMLKQFFFLLKNIRRIDCIICSFGGYWSFFPSVLGKIYKCPVLIILHGTDCAAFKEINYGNIRKKILRLVLKKSYHKATALLPVSDSLVYTENSYYSDNIIKQGYKYFFPSIKTKHYVLHNAINLNKWKILAKNERNSKRLITVLSEGQFTRKGGELILQIAKKMPELEFIFVGINRPKSIKEDIKNIKFIPFTPAEKLLELYNSSKYYLQLSIFEGFGVALCEAMACGCIPIVANTNILPFIIGESGYILSKRKLSMLETLLTEAIKSDNEHLGVIARKRVANLFTIEKRKNKFFSVVDDILINH